MSSRHPFMGDPFSGRFATPLAGAPPEPPKKQMGQGLVCCTMPDGTNPCADTNYQGTGKCRVISIDTSNAQHAPCGPGGLPQSCSQAPPGAPPSVEYCPDGVTPVPPSGICEPPYHDDLCPDGSPIPQYGICPADGGDGDLDLLVACPNGDGTFTITSLATGEIINARASVTEANTGGSHVLNADDSRCGGPGGDPGCPQGYQEQADGSCLPACPTGQERLPDGTCATVPAPPVEPTVCPEGEVLYDDGTCGVAPVEPPIEPPIPGQPVPVTPPPITVQPPIPDQPVTVTPPPVTVQPPPIPGQPLPVKRPPPPYAEPPYVEPPTAEPLPQPACPPGQVLLDDGTCCLEEVCGVIQIEECPSGQVRYADGLCADPPLACEGEGEIYDLYDADTGELISSGVPYSDVPEEANIVSAEDPRCGLPVPTLPPAGRIPVTTGAPGGPASTMPVVYPCGGFGSGQRLGMTSRPFYAQPF